MKSLSQLFQDLAQEVFKAESNEAIPVVIILLENVCHALQRNAALNEEIEAHDTFLALVVGAEEEFHKLGAESISECNKGVAELVKRNIAASVHVEPVKQSSP